MPIAVSCECGKRYRVKDELAGKRAKCPNCQAVLEIPLATDSASAREKERSATTPPVGRPPKQPRETGQHRVVPPPRCGQRPGTSRSYLRDFCTDFTRGGIEPDRPFTCPHCQSVQPGKRFFEKPSMQIWLIVSFLNPGIGLVFWLLARHRRHCTNCGRSAATSVILGRRLPISGPFSRAHLKALGGLPRAARFAAIMILLSAICDSVAVGLQCVEPGEFGAPAPLRAISELDDEDVVVLRFFGLCAFLLLYAYIYEGLLRGRHQVRIPLMVISWLLVIGLGLTAMSFGSAQSYGPYARLNDRQIAVGVLALIRFPFAIWLLVISHGGQVREHLRARPA